MTSHEAEARELFREWLKRTDYDRRPCFEHDELLQEMIATALASQSSQLSALSDELEKVKADIETFWKPQFNEQVERAERAEAALSSPPAPASVPVVKGLEWHKSHMPSWNDDWHTTAPFIYTVRCADENGWKWSFHGGQGYERSPEAAKAAAQADYERRILSALSDAPAREGWRLLPEDLETHMGDFTKACVLAKLQAEAGGHLDDAAYWEHQLKTLDRVRAMLAASPTGEDA